MNTGNVLNDKPLGKMRLSVALPCSLLLLALAACGQRGPLYLPDEAPPTEEPAKEQTSSEEENDEETPGT